MPTIRDEAVCIRHWDWSETSQTVSLFGRETGLIRGVAKGAKREKAPFSGGIELLTRGEVVAIVKPSGAMATITAWDLAETFPALRRSLRAFHYGMYFADLVQQMLHDHDPHAALYDALVGGLRALGLPDDEPLALLRVQWAVLNETGYRPELGADVASGGPLVEASSYAFSARLGGLTADPGRTGGAGARVWRVRGETVDLLRDLAGGRSPAANVAAVARANRLLASYIRDVLGREPATMAALFRDPVPDAAPR